MTAVRGVFGFVWPMLVIVAAIGLLALLGAAGLTTGWIFAILLVWVLPVFVGYRIHLSKDRDSPIVLALLLSWVGVLFALAIPPAGKRCPRCDETIRRNAISCRYCGADIAETGGTP